MKYQNPIVRGFYPDPSVCTANNKYYMVCSSFHYFPGVPLYESDDLVNWKQIGHCLTRKSQIMLEKINSSGGVFAPTIRYNDGRFYMTTTNDTLHKNFYVWTDDIYSEWSEPIVVEQSGIDPSFYFEDGHSYFMSNGADDEGIPGIVQCEIDIQTGKKLTPSKTIWQGSGGRYLESPHLYKIGAFYYLMAAEGGTEYGHMVTYARGTSMWGPFHSYQHNPVLTNRNLGGFQIQGVGHGDLIQGPDDSFWMLHLGFRQTGIWTTFHHLGREVFISPVEFHEDGWFHAGINGTTPEYVEIPHALKEQEFIDCITFDNSNWMNDWCYMRHPHSNNYLLDNKKVTLYGTNISLNDVDSPTFIGIRQRDFLAEISCKVQLDKGEGGITLFMDEHHHYDLALQQTESGCRAIVRLCIGNIKSIEHSVELKWDTDTMLRIESEHQEYRFFVENNGQKHSLGTGLTRYLSSEVAGGFTGVLIGLYAYDAVEKNKAEFTDFSCMYRRR